MRAPRTVRWLAVLGLALPAAAGCSDQRPTLEPAAGPTSTTSSPSASASPTAALPEGPLRDLVPAADEVPAGLEPVPAATGPRDADDVAAFSGDPAAAAASLARHGFQTAYVAQYASRTDARSLTVVAVRFDSAEGARADLDGDVAAGGGTELDTPTIGDASDLRRVELPDNDAADLLTLRFRKDATTWLVAWRATRPADAAVPVEIGRALAERA